MTTPHGTKPRIALAVVRQGARVTRIEVPEHASQWGLDGYVSVWEAPSDYGKSPFLMGKSTINHHFQ